MSTPYNLLLLGDHPLKFDKDIIEIQKTVIHFGELTITSLDKLASLLSKLTPFETSKETGKEIITVDSNITPQTSYLLKHLSKINLPK